MSIEASFLDVPILVIEDKPGGIIVSNHDMRVPLVLRGGGNFGQYDPDGGNLSFAGREAINRQYGSKERLATDVLNSEMSRIAPKIATMFDQDSFFLKMINRSETIEHLSKSNEWTLIGEALGISELMSDTEDI